MKKRMVKQKKPYPKVYRETGRIEGKLPQIALSFLSPAKLKDNYERI